MATYDESIQKFMADLEPPEDACVCWCCSERTGKRLLTTWQFVCAACDVKWTWSPSGSYEKDQRMKAAEAARNGN